MLETALKLFQFGFHGAALVFLYLGYRLLRQVVSAGGPAGGLKMKLANVRFFMIISLAFFATGAGLQIFDVQVQRAEEHPLLLNLRPSQMPEGVPPLEVRLAGEPLVFSGGRVEPTIATGTDLTIDAEKLRDTVISLQGLSQRLQLARAGASPEVGLGADPVADSLGLSEEALAEADTGQLDAAAERLTSALEQPAVADAAAVKASLGWVEYSRGDFVAAEKVLGEAAQEATDEPTRVRALNNLGVVLLHRGDLGASRDAFVKAGESAAAREGLAFVSAAEAAVRESSL